MPDDDALIPIPGRPKSPGMSHWHEHADEVLCICHGITARAVIDAIRRGGLSTTQEVLDACLAGEACGACKPDIIVLIEDIERESGSARG